jgi:DnaJ-class molecular chaperone
MDHYQTLGVSPQADAKEIKTAFRKLASKHHPDKGGDQEQFKKIQSAYETLSDSDKRQQYDNPNPFGQGGNPFQQGNFGDIFSDIFGGGFQQQRRQPQRNPDAVCDVHVDLSEVYTGTEKLIDTGYAKYKLTIPMGTQQGSKFVMRGKGPVQHEGLPPGDLICRVHIHEPHEWGRDGDNLFIRCQIDYLEAITGTVVRFFHLDGKEFEVKVPKNTAPEARLKLQGKGMQNPQGGHLGDLFVIVHVTTPNLTEEQLQKFSDFIDKEM